MLRELDIDAKAPMDNGSLDIIDSSEVSFNPKEDFLAILKRVAHTAKHSGKSGVIVISEWVSSIDKDDTPFYHRQDGERAGKA